jgi:starch phosphorylase
VRIVSVHDHAVIGQPLKMITAHILYGEVWPADTIVELIYYEDHDGHWAQQAIEMKLVQPIDPHDQLRNYPYVATVPAHLYHGPHFSIRVRPISAQFAHPFELPLFTRT